MLHGLIYRGKKLPFTYDNPATGRLVFGDRSAPVYMSKAAALFLLQTSPSDFIDAGMNLDEPAAPVEIVAPETPMETKPAFTFVDCSDEQREVEETETKVFNCRKCGHVSKTRSEATIHQHQCKG